MKKIAVALVHGIGRQNPDFADATIAQLQERFFAATQSDDLVCQSVHWSPALQLEEDDLWLRLDNAGDLSFRPLRQFFIDFAADIIAYQQSPGQRETYDRIHGYMAAALRKLSEQAGSDAPLCMVAHSLGTVITSNFIYDLQNHDPLKKALIGENVLAEMRGTPLEWGKTLNLLYTMGSPLALWSLRYTNFGTPIQHPHPEYINHYPALYFEWLNLYDPDDAVGFPLRVLNRSYELAVTDDVRVNSGGIMVNWSPAAHAGYWTDGSVLDIIVSGLVTTWRTVNS